MDAKVSIPASPHGVFVLAGSQPLARAQEGQLIQQYLLDNPDVCGATVFVNWPLVDNGPGAGTRYNWNIIDDLIAPWAQAGKIVNLLLDNSGFQNRVMQGVPAWLTSQLQTVTCGSSVSPVYWQSAFVSVWQQYVSAVVQHYSSNPFVGYVHVGVATGAQTLVVGTQQPGSCLNNWNAAGYQVEWPQYVENMIAFAGSLHSPKQLYVSFNDYANFPAASQIYSWDSEYGVGTGFDGLQAVDVTDFGAGQPCGKNGANWCALDGSYAGRIPFFVQTLGSTFPGPGVTNFAPSQLAAEQTGPLAPLLQTALSTHVQVLEIYSQDLLVAFDPNYPGYAQYHRSYVQALASAVSTVGTFRGASPVSQ